MPKFEIKHFRSQRGHEGPGFYCILWVDGVKAAEAIDQGDGGCVHWHWFDQEAKRKFDEHVASLPEEDIGHGLGKCKPDADTVIVNLVCEYEMKKKRLARIKRDIKKHCCFRLKSEAGTDTDYHTLNYPYSPKAAEWLRTKYGDDLAEILNETHAQ